MFFFVRKRGSKVEAILFLVNISKLKHDLIFMYINHGLSLLTACLVTDCVQVNMNFIFLL